MAEFGNLLTIQMQKGEVDLSGNLYRVVAVDNGLAVRAASATSAAVLGIQQSAPGAADPVVTVAFYGLTKAIAGGALNAATRPFVTTDAEGRVVVAAAGDYRIGRLWTSAGAAGEVVSVLLLGNTFGPNVDLAAVEAGVAVLEDRVDSAEAALPVILDDPEDAGEIEPETSAVILLTQVDGAETRVLKDPAFEGQTLELHFDTRTDANIVITADNPVKGDHNTLTFDTAGDAGAGDYIRLIGADDGNDGLHWRVAANVGVALSTV